MQLRDYQQDAVDSTVSYWDNGINNVLVVLPTGAGKTVVLSKLIEDVLNKYPGSVK